MLELLIQIALACLLVLTIIWCAMVHHRLGRLKGDQHEMRELIVALNDATRLAQHSISDMRSATLAAERRAREQETLVAPADPRAQASDGTRRPDRV